jgi:hypothetical protein
MRRARRAAGLEHRDHVPLDVRKNYPLRIDAEILDAVRRWADDDLRSLNGQIEFLLREMLRNAARLPKNAEAPNSEAPDSVN